MAFGIFFVKWVSVERGITTNIRHFKIHYIYQNESSDVKLLHIFHFIYNMLVYK